MMQREEVLTVGEVARILRYDREDLVYELLRDGELEGFRVTPRSPWRIHRSALDRFIAERRSPQGQKSNIRPEAGTSVQIRPDPA